MSVGFQKLNILTHIKMATFINVILLLSMVFTLFTTGVYSIQCPGDSNERYGNWKSDGDRCILKCHKDFEPSGCHVLRKTDKDEWTYKPPNCIPVKASYLPGCTAKSLVVAGAVGVGAVVAAPAVLAAAGFGSAGVIPGSLAAGWQANGRQAGSWFALAQSAGVVGIAVATKAMVGTAAAGITYTFMSEQCEVE